MKELKHIQLALKEHFGSPVTIEKLEAARGSKTITRAKYAGVYLAHQEGHTNEEIAKAFGYEDGHSVSNVFARVKEKTNGDYALLQSIRTLAEDLSIRCDL